MEIWPNFFIVGAPRSGTTSLYHYLRQHPKIFMPSEKEPAFFQRTIPAGLNTRQIHTQEKYLSLFRGVKNEKAIGEASPAYLSDPDAPYLIHKAVPNARIIAMLRDPVERSFSGFLLAKSLPGIKNLSFREAILRDIDRIKNKQLPGVFLRNSMYSNGIKTYLKLFGTEKVKIIIFEEWSKDVKAMVKEILKFLDVDGELHDFKIEKFNPTRIPKGKLRKSIVQSSWFKKITYRYASTGRVMTFGKKLFYKKNVEKPQMLLDDRLFLEDFFREDAMKVQELVGRPIPWPLLKK